MATLPTPDPRTSTLAAIDAAILRDAEDGFRAHLGASQIGGPCDRALWYSFRWTHRVKHPARILRLFARGHREEPSLFGYLRAAGITVLDTDEETGRQFTVEFAGGHGGGSMDGAGRGFPEAPKAWHVVECKTASSKRWTKLHKDGVEKAEPKHYAQVQIYMKLSSMDRTAYFSVNKDDDQLHFERVRLDEVEAIRLLARAERIIYAPTPPDRISDDPAWYQCQFCDYRAQCHEGRCPTAATCRTCCHATPEPAGPRPKHGGRWSCARWAADLEVEHQRQGCEAHLFIPQLVPYAEAADTGDDWIEYRMPDGRTFRNGAGGYSSAELAALDPAMIGDPFVERVREEFGARVVGDNCE